MIKTTLTCSIANRMCPFTNVKMKNQNCLGGKILTHFFSNWL